MGVEVEDCLGALGEDFSRVRVGGGGGIGRGGGGGGGGGVRGGGGHQGNLLKGGGDLLKGEGRGSLCMGLGVFLEI